MILIDTSVWIEAFRSSTKLRIEDHADLVEVVTCLPVVQEVLQGFDDDAAFEMARDAMRSFPLIESPITAGLVDEATQLFRSARKRGLTVRSSVDCLIAAAAMRHGATVLHRDRDFDMLARVSALQSRRVP